MVGIISRFVSSVSSASRNAKIEPATLPCFPVPGDETQSAATWIGIDFTPTSAFSRFLWSKS